MHLCVSSSDPNKNLSSSSSMSPPSSERFVKEEKSPPLIIMTPPKPPPALEIQVISQECIKPSSPTPIHLKLHKLSLLDQFIPSFYLPIMLYYPTSEKYEQLKRRQVLKETLAKTLTLFYPLAGKVTDSLCIDCNDEGALYVEAKANCSLSQYLSLPDLSSMYKFVPGEASWIYTTPGSYVARIQETTFTCGGGVIGVSVSHKVVDGSAMSSFIRHWATLTKNSATSNALSPVLTSPNYDAASMFPQKPGYPVEAGMLALCSPFFRIGTPKIKRVVFNESAIYQLKLQTAGLNVEKPTRVEAVSALLWKSIMSSIFKPKSPHGTNKPSIVTHAVDMRRRAKPALPASSMGNFPWLASAICTNYEEEATLANLARNLRESIVKIDDEFVKKLQGDGGFFKLCEVVKEMHGFYNNPEFSNGVDHILFTSGCNFGLYDVDFGWGNPKWISGVGSGNPHTPFLNMVVLMDTRVGKGVEAWVFMEENEIVFLENDQELLKYASLDPSPLNY